MAAKEPAEDLTERLLCWAFAYRMNADLFAEEQADGTWQYCCRLRPWDNKKGDSVMFVGAGNSNVTAMASAVQRWRDDKGSELDWGYRPWRAGNGSKGSDRRVADLPF